MTCQCQLPWKFSRNLTNYLNTIFIHITKLITTTYSISSHNYSSDFTTSEEKWIIVSNRMWIRILRWRDAHFTPNRIVKSAEFIWIESNRIELNCIASSSSTMNFTTERIKRFKTLANWYSSAFRLFYRNSSTISPKSNLPLQHSTALTISWKAETLQGTTSAFLCSNPNSLYALSSSILKSGCDKKLVGTTKRCRSSPT